jgi:hypothetical protein
MFSLKSPNSLQRCATAGPASRESHNERFPTFTEGQVARMLVRELGLRPWLRSRLSA